MKILSKITDEEFDTILKEIVCEMTPEQIFSYPEVQVFFMEELNNEVLERWEQQESKRKLNWG